MAIAYFQTWNAFVEMSEEDQLALIDSQQPDSEVSSISPNQLVEPFVSVQISDNGNVVEGDLKYDKRAGERTVIRLI